MAGDRARGPRQEIDIKTGKVLFQWSSAEHVPYSQSEQPLPASPSSPWDWFHINAVHLDTDGNLLIDARNTWTTYKVNRHSGAVLWQLGGKASSFKIQAAPGQSLNQAGDTFAWQYDPEALGNNATPSSTTSPPVPPTPGPVRLRSSG